MTAHNAYVAIYLIWEAGGRETMVGKTTSPDEIGRLAQRYNWRTVEARLLWTTGDEIAERILSVIKREMANVQMRPGANWYDIPHDVVQNGLAGIAATMGVRFFTTEERRLRHEAEITRRIEAREPLHVDLEDAIAEKDNIVPFGKR